MALKPRHKNIKKNNRIFNAREYYIKKFNNKFLNIGEHEYNVIMYYGIGGIGKTSLQKKIKENIEKKDSNIIASINFETNMNILDVYTTISNQISFKVDMFYFNIAFSIYWSKLNPNISLKESNFNFLEEGSFLGDSLSLVEGMASAGLGGGLLNLAIKYSNKANKYFKNNYKEELEEFEKFTIKEMEIELPKFFSYDIKNYLEKNKNHKFIYMFDTHEILYKEIKKKTKILECDEWLRDLITSLDSTNSIFTITGREKLKWNQSDSEWDNVLSQYKLSEFTEEENKNFLKSSGIKEEDIIQEISDLSEGIPYYLNLSVDTYESIENPTIEHFKNNNTDTTDKIFNRFLLYASEPEVKTLKILAISKFFNRELFKILTKEFTTGLSVVDDFNYLTEYSFISTKDSKTFYMHKLMQNSIIAMISKDLLNEVNNFLFTYYYKKAQNTPIGSIEWTHNIKDAIYYKSKNDEKSLYLWFINTIDNLKKTINIINLETLYRYTINFFTNDIYKFKLQFKLGVLCVESNYNANSHQKCNKVTSKIY